MARGGDDRDNIKFMEWNVDKALMRRVAESMPIGGNALSIPAIPSLQFAKNRSSHEPHGVRSAGHHNVQGVDAWK